MTQIAAPRIDDAPLPNLRAVIGGNRPPLDEEARQAFRERMLEQKPDYAERIELLEGSVERCAVVDHDTAGRAGDLVKQIRAMMGLVNDTHKTVKEPYLNAGRAVDEAKKALEGRLDAMKRKVEAKQTQFLREEEARQAAERRRLQAIAEQEARERREAERQAEAERAAAAAAGAPLPEPDPEPLPVMPAARVEPVEPIKSDFGTTVSGTKVWEAEIIDWDVAYIAVSKNEKVREAIEKAIKGMVRGGAREIDGVRIYQALKASNR
jgi:hypothetical protein